MTFAGIATIPGREESLRNTVLSLYNQVDKIGVFLNGHSVIPDFLNNKKIIVKKGDNSLGDSAKFWWFQELEQDDYYFSCDDDLIYPSDYVSRSVKALKQHKGIITYHGSRLPNRRLRSYYTDRSQVFRCTKSVLIDNTVHIGGTGVMAIQRKTIELPMSAFPVKNMADIWVSIEARKNKIPINVIAHSANWIKYQTKEMEGKKTIFDDYIKDGIQTQAVNKIKWY